MGKCGAGGSSVASFCVWWCLPCCFSSLLVVFGVGGRRVRWCVRCRCLVFRFSRLFGLRSVLCPCRCSSCSSFCAVCCSFGSRVRRFVRAGGAFVCGRSACGFGGSFLRRGFRLPAVRGGFCVLRWFPAVRAWFCFSGSGSCASLLAQTFLHIIHHSSNS